MLKTLYTLAVVACVAVASAANANLITNGGFEDNDVSQNTWRWYTSDKVNGWSGSNIEIWDRFLGVTAVDGNQFAELNAHGNGGQQFSIFQSFDTEVNGLYNLSFYYQARSNANERFEVAVDGEGVSIFSQIMDDHVRNVWSVFTTRFVAVSDTTTLTFTSLTPFSGTVGNFLDAVSVTGVSNPFQTQASVSEPGTLAIVLLGVVGLIFSRYRTKK